MFLRGYEREQEGGDDLVLRPGFSVLDFVVWVRVLS